MIVLILDWPTARAVQCVPTRPRAMTFVNISFAMSRILFTGKSVFRWKCRRPKELLAVAENGADKLAASEKAAILALLTANGDLGALGQIVQLNVDRLEFASELAAAQIRLQLMEEFIAEEAEKKQKLAWAKHATRRIRCSRARTNASSSSQATVCARWLIQLPAQVGNRTWQRQTIDHASCNARARETCTTLKSSVQSSQTEQVAERYFQSFLKSFKLFKDGASYCYEGQCRRIGCDGAMDGMERDNCGVCGGDSSSCIRKRFVWLAGSRGREQSLDIPASATNIKISQVRNLKF